MTVTFSKEELRAAGVEFGETVEYETTEFGDVTLHTQRQPRRGIDEFIGILDGPEFGVEELRDEWGEREHALEDQWKATE